MGAHIDNDKILKVKAGSAAAPLASAISHAIYDSQTVVLRAIGAGAVNQAIKALAIAQSYVGPRGLVLSCRPGFQTIDINGEQVSAITLRVLVD